jgi:hypothetical protein
MATYQDSRYNIALPSGSGGALVLIKTLTASSSGTLSFVDGASDVVLDNTYRTYMFKYLDIHPATDNVKFNVNFRDGDSNYDATKTTSAFYAYHNEGDSDTTLSYSAGGDLAQSTSAHSLVLSMGNGADECCSGEMFLFNPSSTTFVKHFISRTASYSYQNYAYDWNTAGYCNVTAAIDAVQFSMSSGNIDSGTIKLYGIA